MVAEGGSMEVRLGVLGMLRETGRAVGRGDRPLPKRAEKWRGLHVNNFQSDKDLEVLGGQIPKLKAMGINVVILEVNYTFDFQSHPDLPSGRTLIPRAGPL